MKNKLSVFAASKGQLIFAILTIAMFVLAAGAPNASVGIGR